MLNLLLTILLTLLGLAAWVIGVLGLPGNWLLVGAAAVSWVVNPASNLSIGTGALLAMVVLASLGELMEFLAGALGVKKLGGSARSTWYALVGSIAGGVIGLLAGSVVPVIGNVIASVVGSALGSLVGALYGERTEGKEWKESFQVGGAAFIGRILGTLSKVMCGSIILIIFLTSIWL